MEARRMAGMLASTLAGTAAEAGISLVEHTHAHTYFN